MTDEPTVDTSALFPEGEPPGGEDTALDPAVAALGKSLAELDIVDMETFCEICKTSRAGDDTALVVEGLKRAGKLTSYQAEKLADGSIDDIRFDDYVLQEKLGEGGMGEVFKARNIHLGRLEAIKTVLHVENKTETLSKRFQQEARVLARLEHPGITPIYKVGRCRSTDFIAMKYVEGEDLKTKVSQARKADQSINIWDGCRWICEAADALGYAHRQNIIHRDIKPGNLMITNEGKVIVLDMGIARLTDPTASKQGSGITIQHRGLGTPEFMPPEQWADATAVTPASDLYALGCTLFYVLTGKVPYKRKGMVELMRAHMSDPIPQLTDVRPDAPTGLNRIIDRMLAKNPEDRYGSAEELVADLQPFVHGRPTEKTTDLKHFDTHRRRPEQQQPQAPKEHWKKGSATATARRRSAWLVPAVTLLLLAGGGIGGWIFLKPALTDIGKPGAKARKAQVPPAHVDAAKVMAKTEKAQQAPPDSRTGPASTSGTQTTAPSKKDKQEPAKADRTPAREDIDYAAEINRFLAKHQQAHQNIWSSPDKLLAAAQTLPSFAGVQDQESLQQLITEIEALTEKTRMPSGEPVIPDWAKEYQKQHAQDWPTLEQLWAFVKQSTDGASLTDAQGKALLSPEGIVGKKTNDLRRERQVKEWLTQFQASHKNIWSTPRELADFVGKRPLATDADLDALKQSVVKETAVRKDPFDDLNISPSMATELNLAIRALKRIFAVHALPRDPDFVLEAILVDADGNSVKQVRVEEDVYIRFRIEQDAFLTLVQFDEWAMYAEGIEDQHVRPCRQRLVPAAQEPLF